MALKLMKLFGNLNFILAQIGNFYLFTLDSIHQIQIFSVPGVKFPNMTKVIIIKKNWKISKKIEKTNKYSKHTKKPLFYMIPLEN